MKTDNTYCYYSDLPSPMAYMQIETVKPEKKLSLTDIDRIIEMAWEDRTPFDAITFQFGLLESDVKALMKTQLKFSSYKLWRKRVESSKTKHAKHRADGINRFKCALQRNISFNKISKRK
jgi:uncharacterized protein (TIGR03643 family)